MKLGALEAGGTKMVFGIGNERGEIIDRESCPTTEPSETIHTITDYFSRHQIDALGIGSFGPVELNLESPEYGSITTTPKPHWSGFPIVQEFKNRLQVPIGFDTDVNAAALGELHWGAAAGLQSCIYTTIGTGVGSGVVAEGRLVHGMLHPETGHIPVKRHPEDSFAGSCPYHQDCLEGMAAGPALEKRWGKKGYELANEAKVWEMEAYYIAQAVVHFIYILSPEKVILGGGVMKQQQLFPLIRRGVKEMLNGYVQREQILNAIDQYIVPPGLGDNAGFCGALMLARQALN